MSKNVSITASRLFVAAEAVLEVVQNKGGTLFGDELVPGVASAAADGAGPALTQEEVTEAVAFLVRLGFLQTSERMEDE